MSLEDDLRSALHDDASRPAAGGGLDARAAIAGARRRRRPKVAIATGATAFAAVGILAIALPAVLQPIGVSSTSGGAPMSEQVEVSPAESGMAEDSTLVKRAPADRIALCEGTAPEAVVGMSGLTAEIVAPAEIPTGGEITAVIRLTNPTAATITGATTAAAAGFVSVGGLVAWHAPGGLGAVDVPFALEPGASLELPVTLAASSCTVDDDLVAVETGAFPDGLPAVPAGQAAVAAALDVLVDGADGTVLLDLVVTPSATITVGG